MTNTRKTPAKWRQDRNLTLDELAEKAEIARNTLDKVESGVPDVSTRILRRIARALGVSVRRYADSYLGMTEPSGNPSSERCKA